MSNKAIEEIRMLAGKWREENKRNRLNPSTTHYCILELTALADKLEVEAKGEAIDMRPVNNEIKIPENWQAKSSKSTLEAEEKGEVPILPLTQMPENYDPEDEHNYKQSQANPTPPVAVAEVLAGCRTICNEHKYVWQVRRIEAAIASLSGERGLAEMVVEWERTGRGFTKIVYRARAIVGESK